MRKLMQALAVLLLAAGLGAAQTAPQAPQPPDPPAPPAAGQESGNVMYRRARPDGPVWIQRRRADHGMAGMREGKWWKNPELAKKLGLTGDQVNKMETIFQNHRLQLIDLHANLEKQEVLLDPMINSENPNEQQTLAQIDRVAQARAELEKSNARMLFAIRRVLTPEQWKQLQTLHAQRRMDRGVRYFHERTNGPMTAPAPPMPPDPSQPEQ